METRPRFSDARGGLNGARIAGGKSSGSSGMSTVQVYIDGTRVTASNSTSMAEALHLVVPRDIEAIEVYTSVARLPAEFLEDACAVIATWTKSY
jgi:hypothetical protein